MVKAIIYQSNTGHTLQYAKILSEKLGIPYYTIKDAKRQVTKKEEVIYLGWICATKISGLTKVKNKYQVKCYGAVGVYPKGEDYVKSLQQANQIDKPLFYLRGGIDYTKLKGWKRKLFQMVGAAIEKENKPEDQEMIELFKKGANFVCEANVEQLIQFVLDH